MSLSFPNLSRSYDAVRRRVRFWGHDSAMEVPFFLEEGALFRINPKTLNSEQAMLSTFDERREQINAVARKVHAIDRRSFYVLVATDF
jgi:hypothetical protein